jgi:hypothetical protein
MPIIVLREYHRITARGRSDMIWLQLEWTELALEKQRNLETGMSLWPPKKELWSQGGFEEAKQNQQRTRW